MHGPMSVKFNLKLSSDPLGTVRGSLEIRGSQFGNHCPKEMPFFFFGTEVPYRLHKPIK